MVRWIGSYKQSRELNLSVCNLLDGNFSCRNEHRPFSFFSSFGRMFLIGISMCENLPPKKRRQVGQANVEPRGTRHLAT